MTSAFFHTLIVPAFPICNTESQNSSLFVVLLLFLVLARKFAIFLVAQLAIRANLPENIRVFSSQNPADFIGNFPVFRHCSLAHPFRQVFHPCPEVPGHIDLVHCRLGKHIYQFFRAVSSRTESGAIFVHHSGNFNSDSFIFRLSPIFQFRGPTALHGEAKMSVRVICRSTATLMSILKVA